VHDIAEGRSPLMHAVRTGTVEGVAFLVDAGASVNSIDNNKFTALHVGAVSNNVTLDKIELLIESGANPNAKNKEGETAFDLAQTRSDDSGKAIAAYLESRTKAD